MLKNIKSVNLILPLLFIICQHSWALTPNKIPPLVTVAGYTNEQQSVPLTLGMGVVFEKEGFILTGYKNLINAETGALLQKLAVGLADNKKTYTAEIVGVEPTISLGILKIFPENSLKAASLIPHEGLSAGEMIWGGNYLPKQPISTSLGRVIGMSSRECYQQSLTSTMLKVEMQFSPNQIGAPIFNAEGEVFAIYTGYKPKAKPGHMEADDEVHILPTTLAMNIYESLKHRKSMRSPWTGFSILRLNDKEKKHFPTQHGDKGGVSIEYVWPNSPAEKLGIQPQDLLVRFGHYRIEKPADFQKWLYMYGVGHEVKMMFLRDGEYRVVKYVIEERPGWARPE